MDVAVGELALIRPRRLLDGLRQRSPLPWSAWCYWLGVTAPAALVAAGAAASLPAHGWHRFLLVTAAASIAQLAAVHETKQRVFHPAIVFVVVGALVLSPRQLVVMCVLQHLPEWLKQRYAWYIQPFNIANYVVSALAASMAAHAITSDAGLSTTTALAGCAAATTFVVVNRALLAPMLRLARGLSLRETRLFAADDLALEYVLALMGIPVAAAFSHSLSIAVLALAPLVLIVLTQRAMHHVEVAAETISQQNTALEEANALVIERSMAALEALSATVDARDTYTAGHSRRVRDYALAIGRELGLTATELESLSQAALLHDIGKIAVPDSVLLKNGKLNAGEWIAMKSHAEEGARIIARLGYLNEVVPAIRHHHERPDGRGYPGGLLHDDIPRNACIIHVADALDAMTTTRVYRGAIDANAALAEIRSGAGGDFCTECAEALERAAEAGALDPLLTIDMSAVA
jgi:putative nucleotidyltransferase with HDIG domain